MKAPTSTQQNLQRVAGRIQKAALRCGRDPASITLIGVTKGVPLERIGEAIAYGLSDIGENRVQEAREKQAILGRLENESKDKVRSSEFGVRNEEDKVSQFPTPHSAFRTDVRWHLIGHLQRNKAKEAVRMFDVIHSVDSIVLAEELERQSAKRSQASMLKIKAQDTSPEPRDWELEPIEVFIQVNISGEATKFGCKDKEVVPLVQRILGLPHLRLIGLMTIPPFSDDPEASRHVFRQLRQLRDALALSFHHSSSIIHHPAPFTLDPSLITLHLSMGMSHDFEVAIEEGATHVRIGTALFGERYSV